MKANFNLFTRGATAAEACGGQIKAGRAGQDTGGEKEGGGGGRLQREGLGEGDSIAQVIRFFAG